MKYVVFVFELKPGFLLWNSGQFSLDIKKPSTGREEMLHIKSFIFTK